MQKQVLVTFDCVGWTSQTPLRPPIGGYTPKLNLNKVISTLQVEK